MTLRWLVVGGGLLQHVHRLRVLLQRLGVVRLGSMASHLWQAVLGGDVVGSLEVCRWLVSRYFAIQIALRGSVEG